MTRALSTAEVKEQLKEMLASGQRAHCERCGGMLGRQDHEPGVTCTCRAKDNRTVWVPSGAAYPMGETLICK